jgi:hypothetical protein
MPWFLLNRPLAAAPFGAWVGIPLWLTFNHHASRPGFSALDAHLDAKTALAEDEQPNPAKPQPVAGSAFLHDARTVSALSAKRRKC